MTTLDLLKSRREEILALARKYGVTDVRVFGSVARGDEKKGSDIDFLIDMERDRSLFDLIGFQQDMEEIFKRKCDVVSRNGLHWFIRDRILNEARPV